jgi:hypothetical protein
VRISCLLRELGGLQTFAGAALAALGAVLFVVSTSG